jgi:hypothetical protein
LYLSACRALQRCLSKIEEKIAAAKAYANTWLDYQALWDMDIETVARQLGSDIKRVSLQPSHSRPCLALRRMMIHKQ